MEEKERYRLIGFDTSQGLVDKIYDTKKDIIICSIGDADDVGNVIDLLNQQDERIKELEEENNFLEKRNEELMIDRRDICLERNDIFEENQQLKQQPEITEKALKLAVEELDDAKDMLRDAGKNEWASLLNTSIDYFKVRAKEMLENE